MAIKSTKVSLPFLARYYHYLFYLLMLIILLLIVAVSIVLHQVKNRPLPVFKAKTEKGTEMVLTPFNEPNLLSDTLIHWASKAAIAAYSFNFGNYQQQLKNIRQYFTDAGWQDYLRGANALFDTIVQNQLIVSSMVSGPVVIANQGDLPERGYSWRIQIPFLVTYLSANTSAKRNFFVVLTIVRVPTTTNPEGIGIDQFVMVPYA